MNGMNKFLRCIEELRKIDPEMSSQRIATFAQVALHDGCTVKQLCDWLDIAQTSVSRNVRALAQKDRHGNPGADLIEAVEDPIDPRRTIHKLTAKGRRVMLSIEDYVK